MNKLVTQNDFITFLKENKTGLPLICFESPKFQSSLLVKQLLNEEYGLCCFLLEMNKKTVIGALTNKRLLILRNKMIGNDIISVSLNNINDIYMKNRLTKSYIIIDTIKETIELTGRNDIVKNTYKILQDSLNLTHNNLIINNGSKSTNDINKYDELSKLKKLLDENAITKDEFEKEKDKILNH